MKNITKSILAAIALTIASHPAQSAVTTVGGPLLNPANGHNYYLVGVGTWTDLELYGISLGGHLATINDAAENAWINANFMAPNPSIIAWIGLHDSDLNGTWEWSSGEPVTYLNWAPGEPNFDHVHVDLFSQNSGNIGQWNNAPHWEVIYGIVEVPEPSVAALGVIALLGCAATRRGLQK